MTDITLHGTVDEISKRLAEFQCDTLSVTVHLDQLEEQDHGGPEALRIRDEAHLKQLLEEGTASGFSPMAQQDWDEIREEVRARAAARRSGGHA